MKKMSKIVLIAGLTIVTTVAVRSYLNHALVDDAVSKVKVAEKMLYRRGDFECVLSLDSTIRQRITNVLLNERKFYSWFGKSVSFGGVFFFDERGNEVLHVSAFKGNVIRIDRKYIELNGNFLDACGFSPDEESNPLKVEKSVR